LLSRRKLQRLVSKLAAPYIQFEFPSAGTWSFLFPLQCLGY